MTSHTRLLMETNRHHLKTIEIGVIKNFPYQGFVKAMGDLNSQYGPVDESDFNSVAALVKESYLLYDKQK